MMIQHILQQQEFFLFSHDEVSFSQAKIIEYAASLGLDVIIKTILY